MNEEILYKKICKRIQSEDEELTKLVDQGIFYAPEAYIALILGKEIKKNEINVFGEKAQWKRETNFGNGGPSDFAFETSNKIFVFELKVRDNIHSYRSDIEKLSKLDGNFEKFFHAIIDSWETERDKDGRILALESDIRLRRISNFQSFKTKQDRYKNQICCKVGLWNVL